MFLNDKGYAKAISISLQLDVSPNKYSFLWVFAQLSKMLLLSNHARAKCLKGLMTRERQIILSYTSPAHRLYQTKEAATELMFVVGSSLALHVVRKMAKVMPHSYVCGTAKLLGFVGASLSA